MVEFGMEQIVDQIGPAISTTATVVVWAFYLTLILAAIWYVYFYFTFNVKVMLREYTRGGRTVIKIVRAKKIRAKTLSHPRLQFMGMLGFGGKVINQPPAECIYPYKTTFGNTTMYDFVVKDGLYYPVNNLVLGRRFIVQGKEDLNPEFISQLKSEGYDVYKGAEHENVIYSTEGSGLELSRDFDAEQATLNDLIAAAEKYKNRKPIEIAAMYGLMIIMVVGSFIILFYAFYKTGQIGEAVNRGWEVFQAWGGAAQAQMQGPG